MKRHCINCGFPKTFCFLCSDCWRVAILSPVVILIVERGLRLLWP